MRAGANYLPLTGGTLTGSFNIDMPSPANYVNGRAASGILGGWYFAADWSNRWAWGVGAQSAGANMFWERYDDAGTWQGYVLQFARSTGLGTVAGDPTAALGIATKQYVDAKSRTAQARSRVVNGAMQISQENDVTGSPLTLWYAADQWHSNVLTSGVGGFKRLAATTPKGSKYRLRTTVNTADAS